MITIKYQGDSQLEQIRIPENLQSVLFKYNHSKFLECYQNLPKSDENLVKKNQNQNLTMNKILKPHIKYIKTYIEALHKNLWISSGTLLG